MAQHNHNHEHEHDHCHECEHGGACNIEIGCCDGCSHSHGHSHDEEEHNSLLTIIMMSLSAVTLVLGFLPIFNETFKLCFFIASALFSGYELIPSSLDGIRHFKMDENLLVLIAVVAAFVIGEGAEGAAVSLFFRIGENIEDYAVERSKKAIQKLYEIRTDKAVRINRDGTSEEIDSDAVKINDELLVSPFEKIPVDCVVLSGTGTCDASAITGESLPIEVTQGMQLLSGTINGSEVLKIKATAEFKNSAASKIIEAVENSAEKKGNTDKFITKFARIYTPTVVVLAILLAIIPSLVYGSPEVYVHRALVFLVASCPCAMVLSVPLGFFAAIGGLSKIGVIVKGGKYIELLSKVDSVLFDKTGTLTNGEFEIEKIDCANGYSENDVLKLAAYADKYSTHPLAGAVRAAYGDIDENKISNFKEISGNGTEISLQGKKIICGSKKYMEKNNVSVNGISGAQVYVAEDDVFAGAVTLVGKLRETSKDTVSELKAMGIKNVVMLTGDNEDAAKKTADKCGITDFKSGLLPQQKTELLEKLKADGAKTAFVGDGINDTPTLVAADVGIAMGGGTAAAIEVGDVVLMNGNPQNIVALIKRARKSMAVIKGNVWFAIIIKVIVLVLGAFGFAPIWAAVFADVGVSIICVLNSTRLLKMHKA